MDKKLKYYDLMEDLRKQIVSGKIKPEKNCHRKMNFPGHIR